MYIQNFCFQVWPYFSKALLDDKLCKEEEREQCLFPQPNWLAWKETDEPQGSTKSQAISDADLPVARGDEYDNQTYEHLVEYTDAIIYIHPTRCQTMNSLSRTLNHKKVTVNLTEHPGTSKPFD